MALLSSGCATFDEPEHPDYPSDRPLSYSVGVYLDEFGSSLPGGVPRPQVGQEGETPPLRFTDDPKDILKRVTRALAVHSPLVERAVRLKSTKLDEALVEGRNYDFLIGVTMKTPAEFDYEIQPGFASLEIFTWLFGGIPAWFVPSQEYAVGAEMAFQITDLNHPETRRWIRAQRGGGSDAQTVPETDFELIARVESQGLSLYDRSGLSDDTDDYLLTIVIPPMAVANDDPKKASRSLTEKIGAELNSQLKQALRRQFVQREAAQPLRVVFRDPAVDQRGVLVFDLISDGGTALKAMDVYRLAHEDSEEGPYRWRPTNDELAQLNQELAASEGNRLSVELSERIPLADGINVIKVRALREDGVRTTRTVAVFHRSAASEEEGGR